MAESKKADEKPIVDVAHPGKSAPAGNSKSVIVPNRPILKDPMMRDGDAVSIKVKTTKPAPQPTAEASPEPVTAPLLAPIDPKLTAEPAATESKAVPAAAEPNPESEPRPKQQPAAPAPENQPDPEAKPAPMPTETPSEDSSELKDGTENQPPASLEAEAKQQAEHDAAVQKLVDSKQYLLPVNAVEKRRSKHFVALGVILCLILAVAWVDIALDAGLIDLGGVKPVTHFFSN